MKSHVRECPNKYNSKKYADGKLSIIVRTNAERDRINYELLEKLLPHGKSYTCLAEDETNAPNAQKLSSSIPLTQTGQLEGKLILKVGAPIMITSNHEQPRYKNNGIVNGSRGYVDSIQVSKENSDIVEILMNHAATLGLDVNAKDKYGRTAFDTAYRYRYHDIVSILREYALTLGIEVYL